MLVAEEVVEGLIFDVFGGVAEWLLSVWLCFPATRMNGEDAS
jgi:hypothetical protein